MPTINPANLPKPDIIQPLDYSAELQAVKDILIAKKPSLADALNNASEPVTLQAELLAYYAQVKTQQFNDDAKGLLLAFATDANLDHIGGTYYQTTRLTITAEDTTTAPPIPAVMESDADYLARILISGDGYSTAGTVASYTYHASSASGDVKDISITSPSPVNVTVSVLSHTGDGTAPAGTQTAVTNALGDDVRPMTDNVTVQSTAIITYTINATLTFYPGFDAATVRQNSEDACNKFVDAMHRNGMDIPHILLGKALAVEGVQNVTFNNTIGTDFTATIVVAEAEAAYCNGVTVLSGGVDE